MSAMTMRRQTRTHDRATRLSEGRTFNPNLKALFFRLSISSASTSSVEGAARFPFPSSEAAALLSEALVLGFVMLKRAARCLSLSGS